MFEGILHRTCGKKKLLKTDVFHVFNNSNVENVESLRFVLLIFRMKYAWFLQEKLGVSLLKEYTGFKTIEKLVVILRSCQNNSGYKRLEFLCRRCRRSGHKENQSNRSNGEVLYPAIPSDQPDCRTFA